jgi:septal ring factor EnvC (AmiA/AmiB activator)
LFEASLVYRVSSRIARATQRNPVSKRKKERKKEREKERKKERKKEREREREREKDRQTDLGYSSAVRVLGLASTTGAEHGGLCLWS